MSTSTTDDLTTFAADHEAWRQQHRERLADPHGFLAITGLHFLDGTPRRFDDAPGEWSTGPEGVVVDLGEGEELHVDTGCIAAFTPSVDFDLIRAGGVKSMIFGGEGAFFARLRGPGKVWVQSLPFSRLAGRMLAAAGSRGGQNRGEGSVLGGLGDLISGN